MNESPRYVRRQYLNEIVKLSWSSYYVSDMIEKTRRWWRKQKGDEVKEAYREYLKAREETVKVLKERRKKDDPR